MPNKEELAEIMASSDEKKKVEVLSKAVVAVTRQKQRLEEELLRVVNEMARTQQELHAAKEVNAAQEKTIQTLEQQLREQTEKQTTTASSAGGTGAAFGQQVLNSLSSFVGAGGEAIGIAGGGAAQALPTAPASSFAAAAMGFTAENVEKLLQHNEQLSKQVFELKSKQSGLKKTAGEAEHARDKHAREAAELRGLLGAATAACDRLNTLTTLQRSMLHVWEHHLAYTLSITPRREADPASVLLILKSRDSNTAAGTSSTPSLQTAEVHATGDGAEEETHVIRNIFEDYRDRLQRVFGAVTIWLYSLKKLLPQQQLSSSAYYTTGPSTSPVLTPVHLRALMDRLEDLNDLHSAKKKAAVELLERVQMALLEKAGADGAEQRPSHEEITSSLLLAEDEEENLTYTGKEEEDALPLCRDLIQLVDIISDWMELLRLHLPLLQEVAGHLMEQSAPRGGLAVSPSTTRRSSSSSGAPASDSTFQIVPARGEKLPLERAAARVLVMLEGVLRSISKILQRAVREVEQERGEGIDMERLTPASRLLFPCHPATSFRAFFVTSILLSRSLYSLKGLVTPLHSLSVVLHEMGNTATESSHLRNAYHMMQHEAETFTAMLLQEQTLAEVEEEEQWVVSAACTDAWELSSPFAPHAVPAGAGGEVVVRELLCLLETADTVTMQQHQQLREAMMEVAELKSEVLAQRAALYGVESEMERREREGKLEQDVLREQVEILSTQLTALMDSGAMPVPLPTMMSGSRRRSEEWR